MKGHEPMLQLLLESDRLPVALWHISGRLLDANPSFRSLIGYSAEEIREGQVSWQTLIIPDFLDRGCRFLEEVGATGICKPYEEVFQSREGHPIPAIVGSALLERERGQMIVFALDLSSIQQNAEVLTKLRERMFWLSQVVSDLEDEFVRTPAEDFLRGRSDEFRALAELFSSAKQEECEGMIRLLYDGLQHMFLGTSFPARLLERRRKVRHATTIAANAIGKAIETSRLLATELSVAILNEGKLAPTLRRLAGSMRDRYGLEVSFALDDGIEFISDEVKLLVVQGVRELLMNVIEHSEVNAARVTAAVSGNSIQLDVEDDGVGFDPNQLEPGTSRSLALLRERIRSVAGQLEVFSAPGLGTRCRIVLPARVGKASPQTAGQEPGIEVPISQSPAAKPIHVLLVDDHTVIRQGIIGLLKREPDLEIVGEASDGESAIELVRAVRPDVVLMDIYMPGMSGVQATKLIHRELPQVRVIGLSMLEDREMALLMREAGAVGYVTKNGPSEALISAIRTCA